MGSIALSGSGTVGLMPSAFQLRPVGRPRRDLPRPERVGKVALESNTCYLGLHTLTRVRAATGDPSLDRGAISEARLGGNCRDIPSSIEEVHAVPDSQFGPDREGFSLLRRRLTSVVGVSVFQSALEVFSATVPR